MPIVFTHHDAKGARGVTDDLLGAYQEAYAGEGSFHSPERFQQRLAGYMACPGFEVVIARDHGELAGYMFGYTLQPHARWWSSLIDPAPDGFTDETGSRTFAVNELHVRAPWRGRGLASALQAELLGGRREERATLLVDPTNEAREIYEHWGWQVVNRQQPFPDSPEFLVLIKPLH